MVSEIPWFTVQLVNSLALALFTTEAALGRPQAKQHNRRFPAPYRPVLYACCAFNAVAVLSHYLAALHQTGVLLLRVAGAPVWLLRAACNLQVYIFGPTLLLSSLLSSTAGLALQSLLQIRTVHFPSAAALWSLATAAIWGAFKLFDITLSDEAVDAVEHMLVVGCAFGGLSFWDVRRTILDISTREFCGCIVVGCMEALLLLPMLTVVAAAACLCVTSAFEAAGASTDVLQTPVYWVCLYLPFGSVYFLTKRRALRTCTRLLPH